MKKIWTYLKKLLYFIVVPILVVIGIPWQVADIESWNRFGRKVDKVFGVESRHTKRYKKELDNETND